MLMKWTEIRDSMDPLGAPSDFVDINTLPGWSNYHSENQSNSSHLPVKGGKVDVQSPFPYREDISAKIILW